MIRMFLLLLMLTSLAIAEQVTFFVQVPTSRNWLNETPVLVENGDGIAHRMENVGENGWFGYTWEKNSLPDAIFVYSSKDSARSYPIGSNFTDKGNEQDAIDIQLIVEIFGSDSIYYIADDYCWPENEGSGGFYFTDVRNESSCSKEDYELASPKSDLTIIVIPPAYGNLNNETPILVDSPNRSYKRKMSLSAEDDLRRFYYRWKVDEWVPESFLFYMESDSSLIRPIGSTGLARHLNSGLAGGYFSENKNATAISIEECVRNDLAANWPELNPDYSPTCYFYIDPVALFYSVYSEDSSLVVAERRSLDTTEIAYYDVDRQSVNLRGDSLDDGKYFVKMRLYDYELYQELKGSFTVEHGKITSAVPVSRKGDRSRLEIRALGRDLLMTSERETPYLVFNSIGQVVSRGVVRGSVKVKLPVRGLYILKIGNETRRIYVR